jgi:predicted GNAT superfamily acetyltransferase
MKSLEEVHTVKGKKFLLKVETSSDHPDYQKYEDLRFEIWEEPNDKMPGTRNMVCENYFNDGSALFIAAYAANEDGEFIEDDGHFVGFSYGFVGVEDKNIGFRNPNNLVYYSQYTGIKDAYLKYGLGIRIKEFQKKIMLDIFGVDTVSCTFDPLTGVNAYRNIHHFGMDVVDYKVAHYGSFGGRLNRVDVPCDRFWVYWRLKVEVQRPEIDIRKLLDKEHLVLSSEIREVEGKDGPIPLAVPIELNCDLEKEFLLIEIPYDFYAMIEATDVSDETIRKIPLSWRLDTRRAFLSLLERDYKIVDFLPTQIEKRIRDFYVLKRLK